MTTISEVNSTYYIDMQAKMMRDYEKILNIVSSVLPSEFDRTELDEWRDECREAYRALIPQLPYIGGKKNTATVNLVGGAQLLAIIHPLEKRGLTERSIGKVIFDTMYERFYTMPRVVRWFAGKLMMSKLFIRKMKKQADAPAFPGGWRKEIIEDPNYVLSQNVTECGIVTLFKKHNKEAYIPYMCLGDYAMFGAFGVGFKRTQTIGNGASICDFRFNNTIKTLPGWPPEDLEEFNNQ